MGTLEDPCVSYGKICNYGADNYDIYNPDEIKLDFTPEIKQYWIFFKDGRIKKEFLEPLGIQHSTKGWRYENFTNATKPRKDRLYVHRFARYSCADYMLVELKNNPSDNIKFGVGVSNEYLDPEWQPLCETSYIASKVEHEEPFDIIPQNITYDCNSTFYINISYGFNSSWTKEMLADTFPLGTDIYACIAGEKSTLKNITNITTDFPDKYIKTKKIIREIDNFTYVCTKFDEIELYNDWDLIKNKTRNVYIEINQSEFSDIIALFGTNSTVYNFTTSTGHLQSNTVNDVYITDDYYFVLDSLNITLINRTDNTKDYSTVADYDEIIFANNSDIYLADGSGIYEWAYTGGTFNIIREGGNGVAFDGAGDYVQVPNNANLNIGLGNITVMFWMKAPLGTIGCAPFYKANTEGYHFYIHTADNSYFKLDDGPSYSSWKYPTADIVDGTWHHIVGMWDGTNNKTYGYVDGVLNGVRDPDNPLTSIDDASNLIIGSRGASYDFIGNLDELYIYNRTLTSAEINQSRDAGLSHQNISDYDASFYTTGLVSYWNFDNNLLDHSSDNDGSFVGDAGYSGVYQVPICGNPTSIYQDDDELIWSGGDYLCRRNEKSWNFSYDNSTEIHGIQTIESNDDYIFAGNASGVQVVNKTTFALTGTTYTTSGGELAGTSNNVTALSFSDDN